MCAEAPAGTFCVVLYSHCLSSTALTFFTVVYLPGDSYLAVPEELWQQQKSSRLCFKQHSTPTFHHLTCNIFRECVIFSEATLWFQQCIMRSFFEQQKFAIILSGEGNLQNGCGFSQQYA